MASAAHAIELHLYCHGLGDCHLLRVGSDQGDQWIMIDCGIHTSTAGGADRIQTVAEDVKAVTGGKLRAIVGTHEHWDHLSAFHPAQKLFREADGWKIGEIWLAWTEDGTNAEAGKLDKYKVEATRTLAVAKTAIFRSNGFRDLQSPLGAVLGFLGFNGPGRVAMSTEPALARAFGLEGDRIRSARENLKALAPAPPCYLNPGDVIDVTPEVRCYVLAPPHDSKFNVLDNKGLTYNATAGEPLLVGLQNAIAVNYAGKELENDPTSPFDGDEGERLGKAAAEPFLLNHYHNEPWRTIDNDWLMPTTELALQLDNRTNNSSLVLAFEIVSSGHVLIFAADAQIGNWQSWQSVVFPAKDKRPEVTGKDLLERAVFYKVGHHGSRNATMSTGGLELMNNLEFAFNPTDRAMAKKVGWDDIPARALNAELQRRTSNRLIEGDQPPALPNNTFAAGGALAAPVEMRTATGSNNRPDVKCVVCRFA